MMKSHVLLDLRIVKKHLWLSNQTDLVIEVMNITVEIVLMDISGMTRISFAISVQSRIASTVQVKLNVFDVEMVLFQLLEI
jgi:hypothetical protein